ncbi:MAG: nicotinate mononucleotide-dependent phosphoribosyltransferase CobT [Halobacteriota archaeon]
MRVVLVAGTTHTATIEGISAAGADPESMLQTPAADLEIVEYGRPVFAPVTPISPAGCPTPAVITRAVRELVGFDVLALDAGLETPSAAPTVSVGARPGSDIRSPVPVSTASDVFDAGRELGRALPDPRIVVGESIPGGTTTALGVLTALGEPFSVSSSLPENPLALKREVVSTALEASGLDGGDAAGDPRLAMRTMGDPVLAAATGLAIGAVETDTAVTLAGGTQMVAVAALIRHSGVDEPLELASTSFVANDDTADLRAAARTLDVDLTSIDPDFDRSDHVAFERYRRGEGKEGVAMGGALAVAREAAVPACAVREQIVRCYETVVTDRGP